MSINQQQITTDNGAAQVDVTLGIVPGQTQTGAVALIRQVRSGFVIQSASVYCRTLTPTLEADVGLVRVGTALQAVTLEIAATTDRFKLANAILGVSGTIDANTDLATIVQKAITDNIEFSDAYTINGAAASGQFWGAFRIQMDAAGTISTRAVATNQTYLVEQDALLNCPPPADNMINLGTITIRSATGATFTCNTTALNAAGTTVNYNGAATGFVSALDAPMEYVAATLVQGVLDVDTSRRTTHPGALVVATYTSDGSMVVTDATINFNYRPYPMNSEAWTEQ